MDKICHGFRLNYLGRMGTRLQSQFSQDLPFKFLWISKEKMTGIIGSNGTGNFPYQPLALLPNLPDPVPQPADIFGHSKTKGYRDCMLAMGPAYLQGILLPQGNLHQQFLQLI